MNTFRPQSNYLRTTEFIKQRRSTMHILIYKVGIQNYMETKAGQITDHILLSWILANYTLHTDDGK